MNISGDHVHPIVSALILNVDGIFRGDNAPIHTVHVVKNWYEEHAELPPHSPDIYIIEHWSYMLETVSLRRSV